MQTAERRRAIPETEATEGVAASAGRRQAILVLGMHRSGTSAVCGAINLLGVSAPKTLMPAHANNPRGYWESYPLFLANDELLASAGSAWHDWRCLSPQWMKSRDAQAWRQRIKEVITEEYANEPLFFIKDPRICRFLPFYLSVLSELSVSPVAILPVRNPLEVARSLRRRDNLTVSRSILIWLRHVLEAEYYSRDIPRSFVLYDRFLVDWRQSFLQIARHLGVVWPEYSSESTEKVDQFLSLELWRERSTPEELGDHPDVTSLALAVFKIFSEIAANGERNSLTKELDRIREKFDESCDVFGVALLAEELSGEQLRTALQQQTTEVAALRQTVGLLAREKQDLQDLDDELRSALTRLEMEVTSLAQQLQGMVSSTSWKVSALVRIVGRGLPALARVSRRMLRSFWRLG